MLLFQMVSSFVMADDARLSLVLISFVELPSFVMIDPRYLKLSTSSSFCPFILMFTSARLLVLLRRVLLFSSLTSIPNAFDLVSSLVVRS